MTIRRTVLAALAGLALSAAGFAQDDPNRPVKLIVPFGPGTTTDIVSRVFAETLAKPLGQVVVVDNKSGAGGNIGADLVAKAPADGYTIVMGTVGTHAINPGLYRRMPYDAQKDFAPIGFAGYTPTLLVVAANSPAKTPAPVLAKLRDAVNQAVSSPEVKARLAAQGLEVPMLNPAELASFGRVEIAKWSELVKRSGAQVD